MEAFSIPDMRLCTLPMRLHRRAGKAGARTILAKLAILS